ncbi:MAG: hypothetical protein LBU68_00420, partial [Rickettsiales bacterium]|nr:hypothetical protein [Rickettsiales bacterium]
MNSILNFFIKETSEQIFLEINKKMINAGFNQILSGYQIHSFNVSNKFELSEKTKNLFLEIIQDVSNKFQTKIIIEKYSISSGNNMAYPVITGKIP